MATTSYNIMASGSRKISHIVEGNVLAKLEDRDGKFFIVSNDGKNEMELDIEYPQDIDGYLYFSTILIPDKS